MKKLFFLLSIVITSISFSQLDKSNKETWLYNYSQSSDYSNEWTIIYKLDPHYTKYSIYYEVNEKWQYVGKILVTSLTDKSKVYFKTGYKVAYRIKTEPYTVIEFE